MDLFIKNMVSNRCRMAVKAEIENIGLNPSIVELGEVKILEILHGKKRDALKVALLKSGFELMDDKKAILIEKIKNIIVEMIHYKDDRPKSNFSSYLSTRLNYSYCYLSNLFSEENGVTIERFVILHKIEHAKELLVYNELSVKEIAFRLHYSSVAHLSNQFKKVTGLTPAIFKKMKHKRLTPIEDL